MIVTFAYYVGCFLLQGSGWKVVASFEGNFPNRIKQLPLDRHFDMNNVKRVFISIMSSLLILFDCVYIYNGFKCVLCFVDLLLINSLGGRLF